MVGQISHMLTLTEVNSQAGMVEPGDWNSAHNLNQTLVGNTGGLSSVSGQNIFLAGGSNITLSATTDTNSNATVTINGPQLSSYVVGNAGSASSGVALTTSIVYMQNFLLPTELAISRLVLYGSQSLAFSSFASSAVSGTSTFSCGSSYNAMLYSRGLGANTSAIYLVTSAQLTLNISGTVTCSGKSGSASVSIGYPTGLAANAYVTGSSTTSHSSAIVSNTTMNALLSHANWSNYAAVYFPMSTTLEPGEYFLGLQYSSAQLGSIGAAAASSVGPQLSFYFLLNTVGSIAYLGAAGISSVIPAMQGMAISTSNIYSSIPLTNISTHSSGNFPAAFMNYGLLNE